MNPNAGFATGNAGQPRPTAEDNTQPRFELFLLGEGEKKVTEEADTREFSYLSSYLYFIQNKRTAAASLCTPVYLGSHPMGSPDSACIPIPE